jgi:hypothetical protein
LISLVNAALTPANWRIIKRRLPTHLGLLLPVLPGIDSAQDRALLLDTLRARRAWIADGRPERVPDPVKAETHFRILLGDRAELDEPIRDDRNFSKAKEFRNVVRAGQHDSLVLMSEGSAIFAGRAAHVDDECTGAVYLPQLSKPIVNIAITGCGPAPLTWTRTKRAPEVKRTLAITKGIFADFEDSPYLLVAAATALKLGGKKRTARGFYNNFRQLIGEELGFAEFARWCAEHVTGGRTGGRSGDAMGRLTVQGLAEFLRDIPANAHRITDTSIRRRVLGEVLEPELRDLGAGRDLLTASLIGLLWEAATGRGGYTAVGPALAPVVQRLAFPCPRQ